jgi:glycosyltransferase involved in cell wall biosynthesis
MKIAFAAYTNIPDGGAVAHRISMLAQGLATLGHEVHIVVPYKFSPGFLTDEMDGVIIHWGALIERKKSDTFLARLRKRVLLFRKIKSLLSHGLDWLILYDMGLDGLPLFLLAKRYGCGVAADNCDIRFISDKSAMGAALREILYILTYKINHSLITPYLDLNFAISNYIENQLGLVAPKVPRLMVPAPVDTDTFHPKIAEAKAFRARLGLQDEFVIGYCGSRYGVKGLGILLKSARKLLDESRSFKLLITGNSAADRHMMQLIEALNLRDNIILTGYLPKEELIIAMSSADILVEPKTAHEANLAAFPQKLAEYLSMGKAIVASAVGDIPQYLRDQENALLCQSGDSASLAAALDRLMHDGALRKKLAVNARETAVQYFDCRILGRQIEAALLRNEKSTLS